MRALGVALGGLAVALSGCGGPGAADPDPRPSRTPGEGATVSAAARQHIDGPVEALALVPADAEVVTVTDFDRIRARLGVPDLTSADLMSDRTRFWQRYDREVVRLTDGLLRARSSIFELDHGFTQDDVDWEVRWTGPDGPGYVIGLRPDLDPARVRGALEEPELAGARLDEGQRLLVRNPAEEDEPVWGGDPALTGLVHDDAETTYLHRGCVPLQEALGPDATVEDQEQVVEHQDPRLLRPLAAFGVGFHDDQVTATIGPDRMDAVERVQLMRHWPQAGPVLLRDAFQGAAVGDPATGRIGLRVRNPAAAAALTLTHALPFFVCNELTPFEEPTGL